LSYNNKIYFEKVIKVLYITLVIDFAHAIAPNQVSFCAQTGSIVDNHSCDKTYVPYLKLLAENRNPSY